MPSLLAVAAVAALITSLAVWQGEQAEQPSAAVSTGRSSGEEPATSSPPTPASSSPERSSPGSTAGSTPGDTQVKGTKSAGTPTEQSPGTETGQSPGSDMQVVVLNQTTRRGLASTVAEQLRSAGWPVPAVGNFRGIVPSTTVYYPPGGESGALAVAADLPVEPRVRPSFGNLSETRLTVVVTDSYPS